MDADFVHVAIAARSLLRDEDLEEYIHQGREAVALLWWHPEPVVIEAGDRVMYFPTAAGFAIEAVTKPGGDLVEPEHHEEDPCGTT